MAKINFQINLTSNQRKAYDMLHEQDTKFLIARWSRQC